MNNNRKYYGRRVKIPIVLEYRESGKSDIEVRVNKKEIRGSPMSVLKWLIDMGFSRGWFKSGSRLIGQLTAFGIRRCWDYPHKHKRLLDAEKEESDAV